MRSYFSIITLILCSSCSAQQINESQAAHSELIGGPFQNRDLFYDDIPLNINSVDTSIAWADSNQKLLITGTVFRNDGRTPAPEVVVYYYHTNENGLYIGNNAHGDIKGWVRSDTSGRYEIYTSRPAAYPNSNEPAHIHPAVLEDVADYPYYLDAFVFDDDKLLTTEKRNAMENRGGSGVLRLIPADEYDIAEHDIYLGLNIPNYPKRKSNKQGSGKRIGEDLTSFTPYHVWGNDKGSTACPICKYGKHQGILYFTGANADMEDVERWLTFFEDESIRLGQYLKVYIIVNDEQIAPIELEDLGRKMAINHVAITIGSRKEMEKNRINLEVETTIFIYRRSNIVDKYINLKPTVDNQELLSTRLDQTQSRFLRETSNLDH